MSLVDTIAIPVAVIAAFLAAVFLIFILQAFSADATIASSSVAAPIFSFGLDALKGWDVILTLALFGGFLVSVISAFLIRTHPVFFVVALITQVILLFVSYVLSVMYNEVASNSVIASVTNNFPMTAYTMGALPAITVILTLIIVVVTYGKGQQGGVYA